MTDATYTPDPRRWRALAVCFTGGFVTMLDVSIVNVALPSIQNALHAGPTQLQLIIAGYTLAFGLVLVPFGRLGDARGRRRMFMIALAGFALMSLLAGLSRTDTQLALCRLFQGAFAGMSNPQVSGMIQQMFRGRERARAFGFLGAIIGVSTALGPLIGGLIIGLAGPDAGWRWIFFINVPIIAVMLPLARRLLPGPPIGTTSTRLDIVGLILIGLGTAMFMAPFVTTPNSGFLDNPQRWWWLLPAIVLAPVTYLWERSYQQRFGAAVLSPGLLRMPSYVFGAALGAFWFAGFTSLMLVLTLMLQNGLLYPALLAGLVQLPYAISSAATASSAGRLVPRIGRALVVGGIAAYLVGLIVVIILMRQAPLGALGWSIAAVLLIMGAGGGWVISPNQALTFQDVPPQYGSVAGAVMQVGQRVGTAVGMAVILAIYLSGYAARLPGLGRAEAARQAGATALSASGVVIVIALIIGLIDVQRRGARSPAASVPADMP